MRPITHPGLNLTVWVADDDDITKEEIEEIDQQLRGRVGELVSELRGQQANRALSSPKELRFGNKGSLSVMVDGPNAGRITDFEANGGMSPLGFIQVERGLAFPDAVKWAGNWLGRNGDRRQSMPIVRAEPKEAEDSTAREAERLAKQTKVEEIIGSTMPIAGTPAERYLRGRGITRTPPWPTVSYRASAWGSYGALVVSATDAVGALEAVQQVYLTEGGTKAPVVPQKRSNGRVTGSAVKLPGLPGGPLILTEGPENALSVWVATGEEVWAVLGGTNFAHAVLAHGHLLEGREIIIAADGDAPNSPAARSLDKQAVELVDAGFAVRIARPYDVRVMENGEWQALERPDFNDLLIHSASPYTLLSALCLAQPVEGNNALALPPHYNEPVEPVDTAVAGMQGTICDFLDGELLRMQAAREAATEAARQHIDAGLNLTEFQLAVLPVEDARKNPGQKAAITRRVNEATRAKHGVADLDRGRRLQLPSPAGAGKTRTVIEEIVARPGLWDFVTHIYVPDLGMADEVAATFRSRIEQRGHGPTVRVVRGMGAPLPGTLPAADGSVERMCSRWEVARKVAAAGLNVAENVCKSANGAKQCPLYNSCAYQAQRRAAGPGINIMAHNFISLPPPAPPADLIIVDEAHHKKLLGSVQFPLDRLEAVGYQTLRGTTTVEGTASAAADYIVDARRIADAMIEEARAAKCEGRPPMLLDAVRRAGFRDAKAIDGVMAYLRRIDDEVKPQFDPSWDGTAILAAVNTYVANDIWLVKRFWKRLLAEIDKPRGAANGFALDPDGQVQVDGRPMASATLSVHYRKQVRFGDDVPVLILDAAADLGINRRFWGDRLENAPARIQRNAHVVQVRGKGFSRQSITGCSRGGEPLSDAKVVEAKRLQDGAVEWINSLAGSVAVITNKPVEELLAPMLRAGIMTGHFGALRGRNQWQDCETMVVIGRDQPSPDSIEADARGLYSDDDEPLLLSGKYGREPRRIRMKMPGPPVLSNVSVHADPRVQAILETYREREVEQAVDRARLIHNEAPKTVYLLTGLVLDITVDRTMTWNELRGATPWNAVGRWTGGDRHALAWEATGILPTGAADLCRAHPTLWQSEEAAAHFLKRQPLNRATLQIDYTIWDVAPFNCLYRRQGQPGKASTAWLCSDRHPDPRAALESALGPLSEFRLLSPAPHGLAIAPAPRFTAHAIRDVSAATRSPARAVVIKCGTVAPPMLDLGRFFPAAVRPVRPIDVPDGLAFSRLGPAPVAALGDALSAATDDADPLPSFDTFFGDDLDALWPDDRHEATRRWLAAARSRCPASPPASKDGRSI